MSIERTGAVTFKGNPLTLIGPELKVGDKAPNFAGTGMDMKSVTLADTDGKVRIFSVVPSLDTPVCDTQTRRFNKEATQFPDVKIYAVSMDLPFAQSRWCAAAGVARVEMISDHTKGSFGESWGTLIKELRLETRALFVVDAEGVLQHVEYVKEMTDHPDYEAALAAVKGLLD